MRALLGLRMDRAHATAVAARVAQGIAVLLGVAGFSQPLLVVIAMFVWMGARSEAAAVQVQAGLAGLTVRQAMIEEFHTLVVEEPVRRAVELITRGFQTDFPVERNGRLVGLVTQADIVGAVADGDTAKPVVAVMRTNFAAAAPEEGLAVALERMETTGSPVLVVEDEHVVGMVTAKSLSDAMFLRRTLGKHS